MLRLAKSVLPALRIVVRSAIIGTVGLAFFATYALTHLAFFWWVGLLFSYMAMNRVALNVFDQISDRIYLHYFGRRDEKFLRWHKKLMALASEATPEETFEMFREGMDYKDAAKLLAARKQDDV